MFLNELVGALQPRDDLLKGAITGLAAGAAISEAGDGPVRLLGRAQLRNDHNLLDMLAAVMTAQIRNQQGFKFRPGLRQSLQEAEAEGGLAFHVVIPLARFAE